MTLHLTSELGERLDQLAAQTNRSADELGREVLERFLAHREELERAVEEGRAAARRGELVDHEEAMSMMDGIVDAS